jgi:hypothetical protein
MAFPLPLLLLGVGALLLLTSDDDSKAEKPAKPPLGGNGPPAFPYGDCFDANMPPKIKEQVNEVLLTQTDPGALDAAAQAAAAGQFPKAAACLKKRADELRGKAGPPGPPGPPAPPSTPANPLTVTNMPFRVRAGDFPYALAQYYTGQGSRFIELGPLNPNLGPFETTAWDAQTGKPVASAYRYWDKGPSILIPGSWNPRSKNLPVPGQQNPSDQPPNPPLPGPWPPA